MSIFGAWAALPMDWFVRSTGKGDFFNETARLLPAIGKNHLVSVRALLLNCVNRDYAELWREAWDDAYLADGWLSSDPCLTNWAEHLETADEHRLPQMGNICGNLRQSAVGETADNHRLPQMGNICENLRQSAVGETADNHRLPQMGNICDNLRQSAVEETADEHRLPQMGNICENLRQSAVGETADNHRLPQTGNICENLRQSAVEETADEHRLLQMGNICGNLRQSAVEETADEHRLPQMGNICGNLRQSAVSTPPEWRWATPLRTQLDRRQALVELDVIVTKALGLSLDDLLLMYRVSFPVLRKYENDTYYDQNGRCVFSAKSGESYLSRQEWEAIKEMKEGEFKKTIVETVFSDTPTERTITYKAPFFKKDREADYREVWEMLERRGTES